MLFMSWKDNTDQFIDEGIGPGIKEACQICRPLPRTREVRSVRLPEKSRIVGPFFYHIKFTPAPALTA